MAPPRARGFGRVSWLALILWIGFQAGGCTRTDAPPNVLLITVDTLRADHLGAYGYSRPTSPAIDAFAEEGVVFERAMAPRGLTWPSLSSILTSRYPHDHGVRTNGVSFPARVRSVARILRDEHGYETAAFLTNMGRAALPGFDSLTPFTGKHRDVRTSDAVLSWLGGTRTKPFFVWVHYFAPHKPYEPPIEYLDPFSRREVGVVAGGDQERLVELALERRDLDAAELAHIVSLYDAEIASVDAQIDRLLQRLATLGLEEETLVILTSDHGEALFERNHYFGHACSVYPSVLDVPLIMRLPKVIPPRRRVGRLVETIDIAPTLLELVGIEPPREFEGTSRAVLARSAAPTAEPAASAFAEHEDSVSVIRTDRWLYVHNPDGASPRCGPFTNAAPPHATRYPIGNRELYDLSVDPGALNDVSAENPEIVAELASRVTAWPGGSITRMPDPVVEAETREALEALGYAR